VPFILVLPVVGVSSLPVNMAGILTECTMLPGVIVNESVSEEAKETTAATNAGKGSSITHDAGDLLDSKEGGQIAHMGQDVPVGLDTCAVADATLGRKFRTRNRISSTLKQAAEAAYNMANNMLQGTRVTKLGAEFPGQQSAQHCCASGAFNGCDGCFPCIGLVCNNRSRSMCKEASVGQNHSPFHVKPTTAAGFHERPLQYQNPRRGPVAGLRRAIRREERRRGRNLTPEEWQSVRDWCIQQNSLISLGLDYCFMEEG